MAEGRDETHPEVVVLVPVLSRPHRVRPFLDSLEAATPEPHETIFLATSTDRPMIAEIERVAGELDNVRLEVLAPNRVGDYAKKIHHGIRCSSAPHIFTGADDLHFHPEWYPRAAALFADPRVGVVGTQDLAPTERARTGEHATHFLVRRSYVEEFGTIDQPGRLFHEGYPHEFVDDELVGTAKHRGAWAFAGSSVVEHLHPSWGKAPSDPLYRRQRARMSAGARTLARRRPLWASK